MWGEARRDAVLRAFGQPLVLYVHPWELVDFGAGEPRRSPRFSARSPSTRAVPRLHDMLTRLQARGASFFPIEEVASRWMTATSG